MTESTQPELAGMPDPEPITPRWLHLCEEAAGMFGFVAVTIKATSMVPGIEQPDREMLERVARMFSRMISQQIGMRAWDDAINQGETMWSTLYELARAKSAAEDGAS